MPWKPRNTPSHASCSRSHRQCEYLTYKFQLRTMGKPRAPAQGGILEGANPSIYNPANPIVSFIIQVSTPSPKPPTVI